MSKVHFSKCDQSLLTKSTRKVKTPSDCPCGGCPPLVKRVIGGVLAGVRRHYSPVKFKIYQKSAAGADSHPGHQRVLPQGLALRPPPALLHAGERVGADCGRHQLPNRHTRHLGGGHRTLPSTARAWRGGFFGPGSLLWCAMATCPGIGRDG